MVRHFLTTVARSTHKESENRVREKSGVNDGTESRRGVSRSCVLANDVELSVAFSYAGRD